MKKILISLMAIALVVGLVGAGTVAYFSDTETSTNNTFTAGTLDIGLSPTTIDWTNKKPGDTGTNTQTITNNGTLPVSDITATTSVTESDGAGDGVMLDDYIVMNTATLTIAGGSPINLLALMTDTNSGGIGGTGAIELDEFLAQFDTVFNSQTVALDLTETAVLNLAWTFVDSGDQNNAQGDSVVVDITFVAAQ